MKQIDQLYENSLLGVTNIKEIDLLLAEYVRYHRRLAVN
jgi:hypothetical protein